MKKIILTLFLIFSLSQLIFSQVGVGTISPDSSALLDVKSSSKGFLPPRMTTSQRDAIINPAVGLQIFNTTTNCLEFFVNGLWQIISCGCINAPAASPNPGVIVPTGSTILWNWNVVSGATGYRYNTINDFNSSTDNGSSTMLFQTGLNCTGTPYKLFVWAYNACGHSVPSIFSSQLIYPLNITLAGTGGGVVKSDIGGINCGVNCSDNFLCGSVVALTATPDSNSVFAGWSGACTGSGSCVTLMDGVKNVSATFTKKTYTLTVNATCGGTITSVPAGINCTDGTGTCTATFTVGTVVTLTAAASPGANFKSWAGACTGTGSCGITMNSDKTVSATFAYPFTVSKSGTGTGTISSTPAGLNCGGVCAADFSCGTVVSLTAVSDAGSVFTGWTGACTGTGACAVSIDAVKSVTANFASNNYTLTVSKTGTGSGTVSSDVGGINCGATCSASYSGGTIVTLTATPLAGSIFSGWSGACAGTGPCVTTMDAAKSVSATFAPQTYTLTVNSTCGGTITSTPAGINCVDGAGTCTASFVIGTVVTLTASASPGAVFKSWAGACTGTGSCGITMNSDKTVSATFAYPFTVSKLGTGTGTINSTPAGLNCGSICTADFNCGTVVSLTAVPDAGSVFTGWTGACTGTGPCSVSIDAVKSVTANFASNNYTLSVNRSGNGLGSITSDDGGINCGATCSASYAGGTLVTLTATPLAGSVFTGWSGSCTGTGTCVTTMDAAKSVTANFTLINYTLTVTRAGAGSGTITSNIGGINCGATCSSSYSFGTVVTLTATPAPGSVFVGWSGGGCTGTGTCTTTMTSAVSITANFAPAVFTLTTSKSGTGTGTISSTPSGINCGATCTANYSAGTVVTLTASPASGSTFTGWSGGCTGVGSCITTINSAVNVTGNFTLNTYTLTVAKSGNGSGTVTSNIGGINCGTTCSAVYSHGTTVTLSASPTPGNTFTGWSGGGCTGTGTCVTTVTSASTVTATFSNP